jgi:acetate kinase
MKILVINCGSSSLRFQFIDIGRIEREEKLLARGLIERIGKPDSSFKAWVDSGEHHHQGKPIPDHKAAVETAFGFLCNGGVIRDLADIEGVGHRIVHGGEHFRASIRINPEVEAAIRGVSDLAPLHNPHNLAGYLAVRDLLPSVPQVAVFDTAFHSMLPPRAYLYAIPYEYYEQEQVRRYGFHGTSHRYVSRRFAQIHRTTPGYWKLITCHLGNGCSLCAVDRGRSIDTSMGFTPVEGLVMGTRSGDVDPGIVLYLMNHHGRNAGQIETLLNQQSGLLGVSGSSNDMRDLLRRREEGDRRARLAVDIFCYRVQKYIGAYLAVLRDAHAIIFAGGIGENSAEVRAEICGGLRNLGVVLDPKLNRSTLGVEGEISAAESHTKIWVIPTNEELLIARDTVRIILGLPLV